MRTIIAGTRQLSGVNLVQKAVDASGFSISLVISGTATGIDQSGEDWAKSVGLPIERYPANWTLHGKSAGYLRNLHMATKAEALVAIWDGVSRGTMHMINISKAQGLRVYVYRCEMVRHPN